MIKNTLVKIAIACALATIPTQSFGDIVQSKLNIAQMTINQQDILANAINFYIELNGTPPTSLSELKTSGLVYATFPTTFSFVTNISNATITVSQSLPFAWEQFQRDYFANSVERKADIINASATAMTATTNYQISPHALKSATYRTAGVTVSPSAPTSLGDGEPWYNSIKKTVFIKKGANWLNSNGTSFWIVRNMGELPSSAIKGDIAIVITTSTIEKRIYSGSVWEVANSMVYSYNGSF